MNELDDKIREALQKEDAELLEDVGGEPSIFEMLMETFRGRHRWLVFLTMFWTIVFLLLGILSVVRFFRADEIRDMIMWAAASALLLSGVSMMKVWYWMELNKNSVTREIKRLELQIARLAGRLKS
jgi:hypothetical protein